MIYDMKKRRSRELFWEKEYKAGSYFSLSQTPSGDLLEFMRWLTRQYGKKFLHENASVLDLGCGNGRNLIYLSKTFGMRGVGFDTSREAIALAQKESANLPITYEIRSIKDPLPLPDESQTFVLDMMTSHFLSNTERDKLHREVARVLKPSGWFFVKTFLRDEDLHAERLLKKHPASEKNAYVDPKSGLTERVFTEKEKIAELTTFFTVHEVKRSHRHRRGGGAFKRRSMVLYAQKETHS